MRKKLVSLMCITGLTVSLLAGCTGKDAEKKQQADSAAKDSVIVTMPVTSEPESGFDPAYGWGAAQQVHAP